METNSPISLLGSPLLVRANEGRTLHAFGHAIVVLLDEVKTFLVWYKCPNVTLPAILNRPTILNVQGITLFSKKLGSAGGVAGVGEVRKETGAV